ncbi:MAG: DnaT-like ssDNA-binding domain-containing protein [Lamprobacter sp.]|uniref:DnaT-like ssDNA-binding domain-containing protein n=1 Tax=Lamprobacter sp. TaxID=3100796 RepID=UPI002B25C060|nr:DnaT-like ssDNA-binding domain-containing protein [Lamprobacter sp.]MEA3640022.1 DnaT-like ssDNA-binding domain-containing protein [Lamprobacter sp.]
MTAPVPIEAVRAWAWQCPGVTPSQRLVLLALSEQLHRGHPCHCSLNALSKLVALTPRGLSKALAGLDGRYLQRHRPGRGSPTQYQLLCPALDTPAIQERVTRDTVDEVDALTRAPQVSHAQGQAPKDSAHQTPPPPADNTRASAPPTTRPSKAQHLTLVRQGDASAAMRAPGAATPTPVTPSSQSPAPSHPDVCASPTPQQCTRAAPIPPTWTPSASVYAWAHKRGLTRDWVQAQIDEFVIYWRDCGESRKSWDATFINRLQLLQSRMTQGPTHETPQRLADKDYAAGATPLDQIDWLRAGDVA